MNDLSLDPSYPKLDTIGTTTVTTFTEEVKGGHVFRTEVSSAKSRVKADLWSTVADTPERAAINHASGRIQAADVELAQWLESNPLGHPPVSIADAGKIIGASASDLVALHARSPEQAANVRRSAAAKRIAELEPS